MIIKGGKNFIFYLNMEIYGTWKRQQKAARVSAAQAPPASQDSSQRTSGLAWRLPPSH
jgi:hypothetical protein